MNIDCFVTDSLHLDFTFVAFCLLSVLHKQYNYCVDQSELLTRFWTDFTSSVWNFCRWSADISPGKTSQVARSEEKRLFSQAIQVRTICTFILDFKTDLQIQTLILIVYSSPTSLRHFPLKTCSLEFHSFVQTMLEITHNLQNQREVIFDLPRPHTPGTGLLQTIPHPRAQRAGLFLGVARGRGGGGRRMVTGQIEPCISLAFGTKHLISATPA